MWYLIDAVDRVSDLSPDWELNAQRNGAPGLLRKTVIGRPIWAFIEGEATALHYACIFELVRQTGQPTRFRLRCDGPSRQSLLQVDISLRPKQALRVETRALRERAIHYTAFWDRSLPRSAQLVEACSWCKSVKIEDAWMPIAEAALVRQDLRSGCPPEIVHHICPRCESAMVKERKSVPA